MAVLRQLEKETFFSNGSVASSISAEVFNLEEKKSLFFIKEYL